MDKAEKKQLVVDAYKKLKEETDPDVFKLISMDQVASIIQEKLPKRPLYCANIIKTIIFESKEVKG